MRDRLMLTILAVVLTLSAGSNEASAERRSRQGGGGFNLPPLRITSPAFDDGDIVPNEFAGRSGVSPELNWTGAPENTESYAIIFHDLDVAFGGGAGDILHWILWNIPGDATGLPEGGVPDGTVQGTNQFGQNTYFGPGAPAGERYHHYIFELYALSTTLDLPASSGRDELLAAMEGSVVAKAAYVGRFHQ
jgi:Raf kinase inhibitor-like YbhB/YbcL family protein